MGFVNYSDVSSAWYVKYNSAGKLVCMLLLYVDDFMLAGEPAEVRDIVAKMKSIWELKGGDIHTVNDAPMLGTQFFQHRQEGGALYNVVVDQRAYAAHAVDEYLKLSGTDPETMAKDVPLPAVDNEQNVVFQDAVDPPPAGQLAEISSKLIGVLMWLARTCWFHLSVAVNGIAREVARWTVKVDIMARRIFAYIRVW